MTGPLTRHDTHAPRDPPAGYVLVEYLAVLALVGVPAALLYAPTVGALLLGAVAGAVFGGALSRFAAGRSGPARGPRRDAVTRSCRVRYVRGTDANGRAGDATRSQRGRTAD